MTGGMSVGALLGNVIVTAEVGRGHPPEFWADRCVDKIVGISDANMPDHVRQQAHAFRDALRAAVLLYMKEAIRSDRSTIKAYLAKSGFEGLANELEHL